MPPEGGVAAPALTTMRRVARYAAYAAAAVLALACALAYVDFRHADLAWDADAPALRAWLTTMLARRSLAETAPPPA